MGAAVAVNDQLFGFWVMSNTSAIGWASASVMWLGLKPKTRSMVRIKLIVLYCVETTAPCLT